MELLRSGLLLELATGFFRGMDDSCLSPVKIGYVEAVQS